MVTAPQKSHASSLIAGCLEIVVVPGSSRARVEVAGDRRRVFVKSRAQQGQANEEALRVLARHLGVDPKCLKIIKGLRQRRKLIKIRT